MRVTYLASAAVLVEDGDASVLCDPWLVDGAYYGSWCHYPPPSFEPEDFDDVDYVYISHIHPDHFDPATLRRLDSDVPVLIHDYRWDYLRDAVEDLGFEAIELPHNERVHLVDDLHINVLAADDCDPEQCGNFFGCAWFDEGSPESGSTQVDSMAVIDDGERVMVNTNDCPYPMAEPALRKIKAQYGDVDLVCHQYSAAQFYPQSMADYTPEEKLAARREVVLEKHQLALEFLDLFDPDFYMPFAGEYTLAGDLAPLNRYTANPPRAKAKAWFDEHAPDDATCAFLNSGEYVDLDGGRLSAPFEPVDQAERWRYIEDELAKRRFTYQYEPMPTEEELVSYLPDAYESLEDRRERIGYTSETTVFVGLTGDTYAEVSLNGDGYRVTEDPALDASDGYVAFDLDPRLLRWIFEGPERAYWGDAKIGSHLSIRKEPDIYERALYNCIGAFHA